MKYFVAVDAGYSGICIQEYDELTTAEEEYRKILSEIKILKDGTVSPSLQNDYFGVALLVGTVIKEVGKPIWRW